MKDLLRPFVPISWPSKKSFVVVIGLIIWVVYASRNPANPINRPINWQMVHDEMSIQDEIALQAAFGISYDSDFGYTFGRHAIDPRPILQKMKTDGISWERGSFKDASGQRLTPEEGIRKILSQL